MAQFHRHPRRACRRTVELRWSSRSYIRGLVYIRRDGNYVVRACDFPLESCCYQEKRSRKLRRSVWTDCFGTSLVLYSFPGISGSQNQTCRRSRFYAPLLSTLSSEFLLELSDCVEYWLIDWLIDWSLLCGKLKLCILGDLVKRLGHDFSKNCFCIGSMGIWRLMKNSRPNVSGYYWMAIYVFKLLFPKQPFLCLWLHSPYTRSPKKKVKVKQISRLGSRSDHWKFCSSAISRTGKANLRSLPIACMILGATSCFKTIGMIGCYSLRLLPMMVYNSGNITCLGVSGGCTSGQLREKRRPKRILELLNSH